MEENQLEKRKLLNPEQPLWLPPGSIRALLTIALVVVLGTLYLVRKWAPEPLVVITTAAVMGYMQSRNNETGGIK